jgi:ribosomal protein S18 acetylase RimI-like enzyme
LSLLRAAFEEYRGRLVPPSGVQTETVESLTKKLTAGHAVIASVDKETAGCVFFQVESSFIYLGRLAVLPEFRNYGIGTALVKYVEERTRQLQISSVRLGVRVGLVRLQRYYERIGYKVLRAGSHEGYQEPTYVIMEKVYGVNRAEQAIGADPPEEVA